MSTNHLFKNVTGVVGSHLVAMALKDNVIRARKRAKMSQQDLADAIGVRQNTIAAIESGNTKRTRYLADIARALNVSIDELDPQQKSNGRSQEPLTSHENSLVGERNLPVYAAAEGGRGTLIVSSDPVDYVRRPAPLANVKDGYGILIVGDSMSPAYRPGDTVLVHPHLPPGPDTEVVLYGEKLDGEQRVMVKYLVKMTTKEWRLKQYNPPKEFSLPRAEWQTCHRVVGKYNRR